MEKASSERKEYISALRFYCSDFFGYSVFGVTIALGSFVFVLIDRGMGTLPVVISSNCHPIPVVIWSYDFALSEVETGY